MSKSSTGQRKQPQDRMEGGLASAPAGSDPAMVPLPKVDLTEVEALNAPILGSEDQIIPGSDDENDPLSPGRLGDQNEEEQRVSSATRRLDLSRFMFV